MRLVCLVWPPATGIPITDARLDTCHADVYGVSMKALLAEGRNRGGVRRLMGSGEPLVVVRRNDLTRPLVAFV